MNKNNVLCEKCFQELEPKFIKFSILGNKALSIYYYTEHIKSLIHTLKACGDYELKDVFISRFLPYLKLRYKGYHIVYVPSHKLADLKRGFNQVEAIFSSLNLPVLDVLFKNQDHHQASHKSKDRLKIDDVLESKDIHLVKNKKILLVDDIFTTGSTLRKSISLLNEGNPKKIEVLVIAKTIDLDKRNTQKTILDKLY